MDTYEKCRLASARASWRFDQIVDDLVFDFSKQFLPHRLCGKHQPAWLDRDTKQQLNRLRGYSYAHIFVFVEEFIIPLTYQGAQRHLYTDKAAFSSLLRFAEEETKHQRMFEHIKSELHKGLGFEPAVIGNQVKVAEALSRYSPLALYLVTLALELLTQRHYVECFSEARSRLDSGFVTAFRLHWVEESQHTRIDMLEIRALAKTMSGAALIQAAAEVSEILDIIQQLLEQQDLLDVANLERARGKPFTPAQSDEIRRALNAEFLWAFVLSGLNHDSFQAIWQEILPNTAPTIRHLVDTFAPEKPAA